MTMGVERHRKFYSLMKLNWEQFRENYTFIHFRNRLCFCRVGSGVGGWSQSQLTWGEGRVHPGQVASSSQGSHKETNKHSRSYSHLWAIKSHQLICMSLDYGRKPEYLEKSPTPAGYPTQDPWDVRWVDLDSNPGPSCCEAMCCQKIMHLKLNIHWHYKWFLKQETGFSCINIYAQWWATGANKWT